MKLVQGRFVSTKKNQQQNCVNINMEKWIKEQEENIGKYLP
jgi:hypothetical protein